MVGAVNEYPTIHRVLVFALQPCSAPQGSHQQLNYRHQVCSHTQKLINCPPYIWMGLVGFITAAQISVNDVSSKILYRTRIT
jgi:hypothetical protein